jgi:hypothetical protein
MNGGKTMASGRWERKNIAVSEALSATQIQTFLAQEASKLTNRPSWWAVTPAEYQDLPAADVVPGVDPLKTSVQGAFTAAIGSGSRPLYVCHNKG